MAEFLTQAEVDSMLRAITGEDGFGPMNDEPADAIKPYNLAKQERIVRGRMPTLEIINERFSRQFRIGLFNFLRRTAEVSVGPVKVSKYSEFIRHLVVPTNLNLVHYKPLRGTALMVIDPDLVFLMVDNLFGGDGRFHTRVEGRDFTQTEQRIIQRVLEIIFDSYRKSWEPVYPLSFEYLRSEMNTQFANIATPNEVVVTTSFTVELGSISGQMHFCTPYAMIEPIRDLLTSSLQGETLEMDQRWIKLLKQQIQTAEVELVVDLGNIRMALADVMKMRAGDVISLDIDDTLEHKTAATGACLLCEESLQQRKSGSGQRLGGIHACQLHGGFLGFLGFSCGNYCHFFGFASSVGKNYCSSRLLR